MLLFNYAGATIVAILIFLIIYNIRPVIITESNKIFAFIVTAEIIGLFANILSSYADNHGYMFYKHVLIILNDIYYISYIARFFIFSLYFAALLQIKKHKSVLFYISAFVTICVTLLVFSSPWSETIYKLSPNNIFTPGKLVVLIYVSNAMCIILSISYFIKSLKKLNSKDKISFVIAILILFSSCIIDFIFIHYVISDIFFILEIFILYLMFENPEIYYDKKTNILNSQAFSEFVTNNLFIHKNVSFLCFEIQSYSQIKEIYGTNQTEIVLREIGNFLHTSFPRRNCFYLQNGKFAIIRSFPEDHKKVKEEIEERFTRPWDIKNDTQILLKINIIDLEKTVGFQSFNQIETCVNEASSELKKRPNNEIIINDKIYSQVVRKTKVLKVLTKALDEDDIQVFFQPIVDSKSRKIVAAEALARLKDKDMGIIPPVEFIEMAEENGYIEKLGAQVLNKVCEFIEENNIEQYGIEWINVNLSPIQCQNKNLINEINEIINKHNVKESLIHFEITEESMIDKPTLKYQIASLLSNGYKISLDDFGTGFSNFYSIKAYDFSNIKLDMTLVNDHFLNKDNLLPGIIKIFKERDLSITAEGIETNEMADEFEQIGANYLQGYYCSKPIPIESFLKLLKEGKSYR